MAFRLSSSYLPLLLPFLLIFFTDSIKPSNGLKVWLATWNVADNKNMDGKLFGPALEVLLGLNVRNQSSDVYVVSLQENCYLCNSGNKAKLADEFLKLLNRPDNFKGFYYTLVDTSMTRDKSTCETIYCKTGFHGTTFIMVFAKQGLIRSSSTIKNTDCVTGTLGIGGNEEKGVAGIKVEFHNGTNICVAGLHLDSDSNSGRKNCMKKFFEDKSFKNQWSSFCHRIFLLGDFNTKTQYGDQKHLPGRIIDKSLFKVLESSDEMFKTVGKADALLGYINQLTHFKFNEVGNIYSMPPTHSILTPDKCSQIKGLCYRSDRPPSWVDRIIFSQGALGRVKEYRVIEDLQAYSDHLPVVASIEL